MKYRNGKCYDDFGNEMSQAQINSLYKSSQAYIQKINESKQIPQRELTKEELLNRFKNSNFKIT